MRGEECVFRFDVCRNERDILMVKVQCDKQYNCNDRNGFNERNGRKGKKRTKTFVTVKIFSSTIYSNFFYSTKLNCELNVCLLAFSLN